VQIRNYQKSTLKLVDLIRFGQCQGVLVELPVRSIVFDLETTGLARDAYRIVQICAIIVDECGNQIPGLVFNKLVNPMRNFDPRATTVLKIIKKISENYKKLSYFC